MRRNLLLLMIFIFSLHYSQMQDSLRLSDNHPQFQIKKLYVPAGLMLTSLISQGHGKNSWDTKVVQFRNKNYPDYRNRADDYLQFVPFAGIYGFELLGMKPRTDWRNRTAILIKGQILNLGLVYILKNSVKATRPDGSALSFPSGHTADAFAGATMLAMEYGENYKWVPYVSYGIASGVGVMRIANNKHYLSDVLFGAGLGILSMKVAYWTHHYKWNQTQSKSDPFLGSIY